MNTLVIGNGFDLAHKLPTNYVDFLSFILKGYYSDLGNSQFEEEFKFLKEKNFWVSYFSNKSNAQRTWIDFESEISKLIKSLDFVIKYNSIEGGKFSHIELTNYIHVDIVPEVALSTFDEFSRVWNISEKRLDDPGVINSLAENLNTLVRGLETYLDCIVNKLPIQVMSPDIKDIIFDKVLSFNYTGTYERVYSKLNEKIEYDFIHGNADSCREYEENNMVIGIDEYLPDGLKNRDVKFIQFKKYYQRIHKETGCKYKKWLDEMKQWYETIPDIIKMKKEDAALNHIYIFGHSLDVTDRDILKSLILEPNTITTIFYLNKQVYGQQIANLVKVIGQDELIKRVSEPNKTIIFKKQRDMVPIV